MISIIGTLGQLADQDGETIGVVRNAADDSVLFVHVPAEVMERIGDLIVPETTVALTGHLCDHGTYLLVTDAVVAPEVTWA